MSTTDHYAAMAQRFAHYDEGTIGGAPRLPVRALGEFTAEPVEWLWRDRIPAGELTVLAGDGGLGKSTLLAWIAARVTTGDLAGLTGTRRVLVAQGEDDPGRVMLPRFRAVGADLGNVAIVGEEPPALPTQLGLLTATVRDQRPELLILDPLGAHLDGGVDAHRSDGKGGMRAVLTPLARLAQETGTTVVVAAHLNKTAGQASNRIAGAAAVRNAARNVLILLAHPHARSAAGDDGRRLLGHDKSNVGAAAATLDVVITDVPATDHHGHPLTRRDGTIATTSLALIGGDADEDYRSVLAGDGAQPTGDHRDAVSEAIAFLRIELADGEVPTRHLKTAAGDAGYSWRTVERAMSTLGVQSAKRGPTWVRFLPHGGHGGHGENSPESPVAMGDSVSATNAANDSAKPVVGDG